MKYIIVPILRFLLLIIFFIAYLIFYAGLLLYTLYEFDSSVLKSVKNLYFSKDYKTVWDWYFKRKTDNKIKQTLI